MHWVKAPTTDRSLVWGVCVYLARSESLFAVAVVLEARTSPSVLFGLPHCLLVFLWIPKNGPEDYSNFSSYLQLSYRSPTDVNIK